MKRLSGFIGKMQLRALFFRTDTIVLNFVLYRGFLPGKILKLLVIQLLRM